MDEEEEMKTFSSSDEESDETDEDIENERRLQKALLEKDKVWNDIFHLELNPECFQIHVTVYTHYCTLFLLHEFVIANFCAQTDLHMYTAFLLLRA